MIAAIGGLGHEAVDRDEVMPIGFASGESGGMLDNCDWSPST